MNNITKLFAITGISFSIAFSGCDKAEEIITDPTPTASNSISFSFADGYGVLVAVKSVSYTTVAGITVPVELNTGVAAFPTSMGSSTFVDAGTVTLNSKSLTKQSNNSYVYQNLTDLLSFNTINWAVSGSSGVPAITYSDDDPIPAYSGYSSLPSSVTRSSGLTIQLGSTIDDADSVYCTVSGGSGYILKRVAGNAAECSFSASELSALGTGTGMIQVVPWSYKTEDFNSKKFYFVLETAYSKIGVTVN
jgi:hypothetical protein